MPGLRDASLASALATRIFRRRQAQRIHALSGGLEAGEVAEFRDGRDRHRKLHTTEGLQRVHDRTEPPGGDLLVEFLVQALESVSMFGDRPDVFLEDDLLGGGGTDDLAQPAQGRRVPSGPTGLPDILPQQTGFEADCGRLEIVACVCPRAAPVTHRVVLDRWDIDRRKVP
jgi:hypothetical protein